MAVTGRRIRTLIALITVGAGLALASPSGAADPPVTIVIELERSTSYTYEYNTILGQISPAGATKNVVVQGFVDGAWVDRSIQRVSLPNGAFETDIYPHTPGPNRLRVRSAGGTVISNEVVLNVVRHPTVIKASASPSDVTAGQRTQVTGWVVEPRATPRVVVQRRINGRWYDRDGGRVDSSGNFSITVTPSQSGPYELRVRSAQGSRWSETFTLSVAPRPVP